MIYVNPGIGPEASEETNLQQVPSLLIGITSIPSTCEGKEGFWRLF